MADNYTKDQLNKMEQSELIALILSLQDQLSMMNENYKNLNNTMQIMMEQLADMKRHRFGRSTEKMDADTPGQITFFEPHSGMAYFNEAEAIADLPDDESDESDESAPPKRGKKKKGKLDKDIKDLPVDITSYDIPIDQLEEIFGKDGYKRLPDEIQRQYRFTPAKISIDEFHIAVYAAKQGKKMVKADHPKKLLPHSMVSPTLGAGVMTAKYVNAGPLYRQETSLNADGIHVTRKNLADWMIKLSDRYLHPIYLRMHELLLEHHVIQADETPVLVNKDGRPAGSKSYMWVYRTGVMDKAQPIVLYEYEKTRKADHPREFLKDFKGICLTDGYQVYHTVEQELEDLKIAGCWVHARRRYDEALKALPKDKRKGAVANTALKLIQAIFNADNALDLLSADERLKKRHETVAPLVDAYFEWVKQNIGSVLKGTKTEKGMQYSINQEKYLRVFLTDGDVAMDNNGAERAIRPFCIGKKNWEFCDTISGAKASAVIYSITETAKANNLRPYNYLVHLFTEVPKYLDETDITLLDELLPWSKSLPKDCYKI